MDKTTDKKLLVELTDSIPRWFSHTNWAMWTRSKQKAFTVWMEYMEKCIEKANKPYDNAIKWGWDNDRMHDEETDDEEDEDDGNAPLFEKNIVFGNFFSREQFEEECAEIPEVGFGIKTHISNYFDEFQEHIHGLGREGHFNELMKEYFEFWLETNQ
tara:strand:+ start:233 stop:703 length:471 start_codon:yes stop_codon:yes gene_type:complete